MGMGGLDNSNCVGGCSTPARDIHGVHSNPVKFSGRLIQYIGRALRPAPGKNKAVRFNFVDVLNPVFEASAKSRRYTYENQGIKKS